jgi:hypothetical protein
MGHSLPNYRRPKSTFVRFGPKADKMLQRYALALAARNADQSSFARLRSGVVMLITRPRMSRLTRA